MRYIDEFRNKNLARDFSQAIKNIMPPRKVNLMEVCGTHTQSFHRFSLDKILPTDLKLIAGPGCPVCVSTQGYIDAAIALARDKNRIILTFGDLLRVPGTDSTLEKESSKGANVQVVYSAWDCLGVARNNPQQEVVFLAVGFETTAPTIALTIMAAKKEKIKNLFSLSSLRLIPPAMDFLAKDRSLNLDGFLCPGHVSAIIGARPYEPIQRKYGIGCCIAGFEPLDILEGIFILLRQIIKEKPKVENQYIRVVTRSGNIRAKNIIKKVFMVQDAYWRGLGKIPQSGLKIREEFSQFDAETVFGIRHTAQDAQRKTQCRCGDILKGLIRPDECPLFRKSCTPERALGPCMVSGEGACNAYYKYH